MIVEVFSQPRVEGCATVLTRPVWGYRSQCLPIADQHESLPCSCEGDVQATRPFLGELKKPAVAILVAPDKGDYDGLSFASLEGINCIDGNLLRVGYLKLSESIVNSPCLSTVG